MQTRPYVLWWSSPSQLATNDQQAKSSHISGRSRICQTGWGGRPRRRAQRRALMGVWATASSRVQGQTPRRWKLFVNFHRKEASKVTDLNDSSTPCPRQTAWPATSSPYFWSMGSSCPFRPYLNLPLSHVTKNMKVSMQPYNPRSSSLYPSHAVDTWLYLS